MSNLDLLILQLFQQSDKVELAWVGLAQAQDLAAVRYCIQIQTVSELVQPSNRQANSIPLQMYKSIGLWKVELSSEKLTLSIMLNTKISAQHMGSESPLLQCGVKIRTLVFLINQPQRQEVTLPTNIPIIHTSIPKLSRSSSMGYEH